MATKRKATKKATQTRKRGGSPRTASHRAVAVATSARRSVKERTAAAAQSPLAVCESEKDFQAMLKVLCDTTEPVKVRLAALQSLQAASFSVLSFEGCRGDYIATLRQVAEDHDPELRQRALGMLMREKDGFAQKKLLEGLRDPDKALLPPEKALQLLSYDVHADAYEAARAIVRKPPNEAARREALRLLAADATAAPLFEKLLLDKNELREIRQIAASALYALQAGEDAKARARHPDGQVGLRRHQGDKPHGTDAAWRRDAFQDAALMKSVGRFSTGKTPPKYKQTRPTVPQQVRPVRSSSMLRDVSSTMAEPKFAALVDEHRGRCGAARRAARVCCAKTMPFIAGGVRRRSCGCAAGCCWPLNALGFRTPRWLSCSKSSTPASIPILSPRRRVRCAPTAGQTRRSHHSSWARWPTYVIATNRYLSMRTASMRCRLPAAVPVRELLATLAWLGPHAASAVPELEALRAPGGLPPSCVATSSVRCRPFLVTPASRRRRRRYGFVLWPTGCRWRRAVTGPRTIDSVLLEDHAGDRISFNAFFRGQPSIVVFFYTRCDNPLKCSLSVAKLARAQQLLDAQGVADRIRTAAVTYDPAFDLPARLRVYGLDRGVRMDAGHRLFRAVTGNRGRAGSLRPGRQLCGVAGEPSPHRAPHPRCANPHCRLLRAPALG